MKNICLIKGSLNVVVIIVIIVIIIICLLKGSLNVVVHCKPTKARFGSIRRDSAGQDFEVTSFKNKNFVVRGIPVT